jgi:flagellin
MALRISTNTASLSAQRHLEQSTREVENSFKALASGTRLATPQVDAAGFSISELLRGQVAGIGQANQNAKEAMAFLQTAEGTLNEQTNILIRMRELAVNAASDTVGEQERQMINQEFTQLNAEVDRIAKSTRFGSKELLTGSGQEFSFQVGPFGGEENVVHFTLESNTTASALGVDGLDLSDKSGASSALSAIDQAVTNVALTRGKLGGIQNRMQFAIDNLQSQKEHVEEARSLIADVDVAEETSKLARAQVVQQAGLSVLAQANQYPLRVMKLVE